MTLQVARSPQLHNPTSYGCVLYLPLWHNELRGSPFSSVDVFRHICSVTGGAIKGALGRICDGDDHINIDPSLTQLASTTAGTFEAWIMMPDATPAAESMIVCYGDASALEMIRYYVNANGTITGICYKAGTAQWSITTTNAVLTDNVFSKVSLVQNGTTPKLRVNGVEVAQTLGGGEVDVTAWFADCAGIDNGRIASRNAQGLGEGQWLTGTVGEVAIYDRAKSVGEDLHDYQVTKWRYL